MVVNMSRSKERPIPSAALKDEKSVEMLRLWLADGGLHCSILAGSYVGSGIAEETAWGMMLADAARHVGNALKTNFGYDDDVVTRIKEAFDKAIVK